MRKIESLFIGISLFAVIIATGITTWQYTSKTNSDTTYHFPETQFGSFLAAQHAIYVNDFDTALQLTDGLRETEFNVVNNTRLLSEFLGGRMPKDVKLLREEKQFLRALCTRLGWCKTTTGKKCTTVIKTTTLH